MRSGRIYLNIDFLYEFGLAGFVWDGMTNAFKSSVSATAYRLTFNATNVSPRSDFTRSNGFPVRCLASGD